MPHYIKIVFNKIYKQKMKIGISKNLIIFRFYLNS